MGMYYCEKAPSSELLKSSFCPAKNLLATRKTPDFPGKRIKKKIVHEISHFLLVFMQKRQNNQENFVSSEMIVNTPGNRIPKAKQQ